MQQQQMNIDAMKTPAMDPAKNGELAAQEAAMQQQQQQSLMDQAGQLAGAPLMDPSKNPQALPAMEAMAGVMGGQPEQLPPQ